MIYLNDHIDDFDVPSALRCVSPQRLAHATRYRHEIDRRLSLAVYMLLCEALRNEYGITEPPLFDFGPHGKPVLRNHPDIHFNLSHCRRAALCVVSDRPVGCDIEDVPAELDLDICRYCSNDVEIADILASDNPPLEFFTRWTRKEAYLKRTGEGLTNHLSEILNTPQAAAASFQTTYAPHIGCVYTICQ